MSDWETTTFADLMARGVLGIGDGYRAKNSELGGTGPIFLRAGHVQESGIDFGGADRFKEDLTERVTSKMSRPGDVMVTTKGNSTGQTAFVSTDFPPFVYSPHTSYWRSLRPDQVTPGFLRYWSASREFRSQLAGMAASTDMAPYLSLRDQVRLKITLPPPQEQRAIADTLGAFDDKIELNRRMNETLDEMAQAIFKSWFVDFDPVRAKMDDRQPIGMDADTAALFPDEFEASELGEIPKGWEVLKTGDIAPVLLGGTPDRREPSYWGGAVPWINSGAVNSFRVIEPTERITEEGLASSSAKLMPPRTTLVAITGATLGQVSLLEIEAAANQSVVGILPSDRLPGIYLYLYFAHHVKRLIAAQTGAAQQHINKGNVEQFPVLVPPQSVLDGFLALTGPMMDLVASQCRESLVLAEIRDTLLPKLMSGELRVPLTEGNAGTQP